LNESVNKNENLRFSAVSNPLRDAGGHANTMSADGRTPFVHAELLGLPLERALELLTERGFPAPRVNRTAAPDFFASRDPRPRPDVRVVRAKPGELTVAAFRAPAWEEVREETQEEAKNASVPN
jgi:hypothetical protein